QLLERAFGFTDVTAAEVMVPRTEVVAIPIDASVDDIIGTARRYRHTRYPVFEGSIDNVVGVLSAKDLIGFSEARDLRRMLRPPVLVPSGAEAADVLANMRAARQPLAVVLDEYGGTLGIVTLHNLVARLFGEIGDEHTAAAHRLRVLGDGTVVADGLMLIEDVNNQLGTRFDASEVDTLGGLVFAKLGRRPGVGDRVEIGSGYE